MKCEREIVRSVAVKDTLNPEWNFSGIFYRRQPISKPIKIQVNSSVKIIFSVDGMHIKNAIKVLCNLCAFVKN